MESKLRLIDYNTVGSYVRSKPLNQFFIRTSDQKWIHFYYNLNVVEYINYDNYKKTIYLYIDRLTGEIFNDKYSLYRNRKLNKLGI